MFKVVGIVGAGQMGMGIAHICALKGLNVRLIDSDEAQLSKANLQIHANMDRQIARAEIGESERDDARSRIVTSTDYHALESCEMVLEAVTELEEVKRKLFKSLIPLLPDSTLLASNTSSISITRLAAQTGRPEQFCGVHFMKPAYVIQLVELIRGLQTSNATYTAFNTFAKDQLGKIIAVSEDFPGFIVNRILMPMINEAIYTLYEGVGSVADIDAAMRLGTKHPLGPLELADFVGLDVVLAILNVLHGDLADAKYRPCPLLTKYVEAGWLGTKTGRGFYDYSQKPARPTR